MDLYRGVARFHPKPDWGLTRNEVAQRKNQGLVNGQQADITKSTWQIIRENVFTLFNAFNFGIGVCIALVGAYKNLLYLGVIVLNILIGIVQELRSKKVVEKLSLISAPHACIVRDGKEIKAPVEELVLDDIMTLRLGNQICADAVVVSGEVEVDESLLTGEADPVTKSAGESLMSGSFVVSGSCRAQVMHIGADNYAAKITAEAKKYKKVNSVLLKSLNQIVKFTGVFVIPLGILLVLNSIFLLHESIPDTVVATASALLGMMPKGLVLLTSVSLAVGVVKLAKKKTLVQDLYCIETLSRVDTLCLDKTGTITEGRMTVSDVIELESHRMPISVNTAAANFVSALDDDNATFVALKKRFGSDKSLRVVQKTPFSSARKWSSVTFEKVGTILFGAPEILLKNQSYRLPSGIQALEQEGCRVLLMAWTDAAVKGILPEKRDPVAAVILHDPVRSDAKDTLDFFRSQDVELKIISGDNPVTVSSIAKQAGFRKYDSYLDASTVKSREELAAVVDRYTIFGRVTPEQKRTLVHALQKKGHVVAMTGDGVNDVLALRDADCSIAMASGSDAARQVSQLVLLESNFSALPNVVMEGRRVINNITRTASLFMVKTIFSFLLSFMALFFQMPYPLIPIQLTLIGLVAEGLPSFVLALEPNKERVKGNFLQTILGRAFPSAIIIVLYLVVVDALAPLFGMSELETVTLGVYLTGFIWLMQLFEVCRPFNMLRAVLWGSMTAGFFLLAYFGRSIFSLGTLSSVTFPIFLVMAALCYPLQLLLEKCGRMLIRRYKARHKNKR
ncbi:MAG: cation-translocating P-type ATPase [Clostridiales bacterium]|nr:cation-translocating P-type ATPase [Clostridiales bacterium]